MRQLDRFITELHFRPIAHTQVDVLERGAPQYLIILLLQRLLLGLLGFLQLLLTLLSLRIRVLIPKTRRVARVPKRNVTHGLHEIVQVLLDLPPPFRR